MAVVIRLQRHGRSKRPFYRIVAIDSRNRRDGRELERLGWYNPLITDDNINTDTPIGLNMTAINATYNKKSIIVIFETANLDFDYNILHLQAKNTEAVSYELKIFKNG